MSELKISLHLRLSEIEISVLKAEIFINIVVVLYINRRRSCFRIYLELINYNLDIACRDILVL